MVHSVKIKKEISMKKNNTIQWFFIVGMISLPWVMLATIWKDLPDTIPVHFGISGQPDGYGKKSEILLSPVISTVLSILIYLLLTNIYKIDPKRYAANQSGTFKKIAVLVVLFLTCLSLLILYWTIKKQTDGLNIFFVLMGLFFAYMGNVLHSIKPNYFAGFRLPWTLESESNWKVTHLLAGKIWFAGGLLIAILGLFIKPFIMFFVMMAIVTIMVIIPTIYSYRFFKKELAQKRSNQP
jgi:uncharacterized membrane protein